MSYQVLREYFKKRLVAKNWIESKRKFNFESDLDFNNMFLLENPSTEIEDPSIVDRFFPNRTFIIKLAKKISEQSEVAEYDWLQIQIDQLLKDIPNPTNFQSDSIRNIRYVSHVVEEQPNNYLLATINFMAEDELFYG